MTYNEAFDCFHDQGLIHSIGPSQGPPSEKRSPNWDPNSYCRYHKGRGHTTEKCLALKDRVQDFIDSNLLHVPRRDKKARINNNSNSGCKGKKNDYPSSSENT